MAHQPPILVRLLLAIVALSWGSTSLAQESYRYFECAVPLERQARLALRQVDRDAAFGQGWEDRAAGFDKVEPWPIAGWFLVDATIEAQGSLMDELSAQPALDFVSPVWTDDLGGPMWSTDALLIGGHSRPLAQEMAAQLSRDRAHRDLEIGFGGIDEALRWTTTLRRGDRVLALANRLADDPRVRFSEPERVFTGEKDWVPNDDLMAIQWGLHNVGITQIYPADIDMDAAEAWDLSVGRRGVLVAIIDDGVARDHPDLPNFVGVDMTSEGPGDGAPVNSMDNHGTVVAGCIAARIDNCIGVAGLAPECRIASVRVYISISLFGFTVMNSWSVMGLDWAELNGARISCNSVTLGSLSATISTKYDQTNMNGMLHYASSGNNPLSPTLAYPANLSTVRAISGLAPTGLLMDISTFGAGVDYTAPADAIATTDRPGLQGYWPDDYVTAKGTTFAAANASGVAALLLSVDPSLTAADVDRILRVSCNDWGPIGYDVLFGNGLMNAYQACWWAALRRPDPERFLHLVEGGSGDEFGARIAAVEDMDGDGLRDFAVGEPAFDPQAGVDAGRVRIFSSISGQQLTSFDGAMANDRWGQTLAELGDVDGDGLRDYCLGSSLADGAAGTDVGRLEIYRGGVLPPVLLRSFEGAQVGDELGASVTNLDDLNADGRDEFAYGAPGRGAGAVFVEDAAGAAAPWSALGDAMQGDAEFGFALAVITDLDGDGFDDLLVGAPGSDPGAAPSSGRCAILSGSDGSLIASLDGALAGGRFGSALLGLGDLDGDGLAEFSVAAPLDSSLGPVAGAVHSFSGGMRALLASFFGSDPNENFGHRSPPPISMAAGFRSS